MVLAEDNCKFYSNALVRGVGLVDEHTLPIAGLASFGPRRRRSGELGCSVRQPIDAMRVQRTDGHQQFLTRPEGIDAQLRQVLGRQRGEHVDVHLVDDECA